MTKFLRNRYCLKLGAIACGAFAVRLIVAIQLALANGGWNPVFHPSRATDLNTYMELARAILHGNFSGAFYYQPFYYSVFLPLVYLVGGGSNWAVLTAQSLLGAFTCYLAGLIAARLYGRAAGVVAALLASVSVALIFYTPYCMIVTLQAFNLALAAYFTVLAVQKRGMWRYFYWLGAMLGVGILTRGNLWLILGGVLILLFWQGLRRREYARAFARCGIVLGMALLVQAPFILYNSVQLGRISGPSTASGAVLALGNTPEAPPGFLEYPVSYEAFMAREKSGESSVAMQVLAWAWREPGALAELTFRKLLLFWDQFEIYNNVSIYYDGAKSPLLHVFSLLGSSGALLALCLAGMLLFLHRWFCKGSFALAALYGFVLVYWGSISAFYILSRFRAPILPLAAVFGAMLLVRIVVAVRRMHCREIFCSVLPALVFGIFITLYANGVYREYLESSVMRLVRPDGIAVALPNGSTMRLDSGPRSCGQWSIAPLRNGIAAGKLFAGMPSGAVKCRVRVCLTSRDRTGIIFLANGEEKRMVVEPGMAGYEFDVEICGGLLVLKIVQAGEGVGMVFDRQRQYYRSSFEAQNLPGEWVMRAFY